MANNGTKPRNIPTFKLALIVGFFVAFCILLSIGLAIIKKQNQSLETIGEKHPEVIILKEIKEVQRETRKEVSSSLNVDEILARVVPRQKDFNNNTPINPTGIVKAGKINISAEKSVKINYVISHPKVESLIKESFSHYLNGDMVKATVLLEEAKTLDPTEPAIFDFEAQIAEDIGALKKARDLYLKVFQLGISTGSYYRRASHKLEKGVGQKIDDRSHLMFGAFNIERSSNEKSAVITIPIRSKEGETIIPQLLEVQVNLYDIVNGEKIEPAAKNSKINSSWLDSKRDWSDSGEESIKVEYQIPEVDDVERYLYGDRKYYGQVVELIYKGELQDVISHPRKLFKKHAQINYVPQDNMTIDTDFEDYNQMNPLLPPLEE